MTTADEPSPNIARLAVACDLYDKLTLTSQTHYTALNALRAELYAAVFDGYEAPARSQQGKGAATARLERQRLHEQRWSSALAVPDDYTALTPYFVQVRRLREALATSQEHNSQLRKNMHLQVTSRVKLSLNFKSTSERVEKLRITFTHLLCRTGEQRWRGAS